MKIETTIAIAAAIAAPAAALAFAAAAAADTTSILNVGDDNLGYSIGFNGGSVALGGYRTTVDGINTFTGTTTFTGPGIDTSITEEYSLSGVETTGHFNTPQVTFSGQGEIYYTGQVEGEFTTNGYTIVCDPICHEG